MAKKTWTITLAKKSHSVQFNTGGMRSMPVIKVDDKPVETSAIPKTHRFPMFSDFTTTFHNHTLLVRMSTNGFINSYELAVDNVSVVSGLPMPAGPYIPAWSWPFFFACIAVTFMNMNNIILSLAALVTAFGCIAIASKPTRKLSTKVAFCAFSTLLAWAVYFMTK